MQTIVLGMHRSGTSMLTRLMNLMGLYIGPDDLLVRPNSGNPKGYWERTDVYQLNDSILDIQACNWKMLADWNFERTLELPNHLAATMRLLIRGMDEFRPWVVKDPRLCLTLPYWMSNLGTPLGVLAYRDPLEIVSSLTARGIPPFQGLSLWEYHVVGALNASKQTPRVFVRHDNLRANPMAALSQLFSELKEHGVSGLRVPSASEIEEFIDPTLYRARAEVVASEVKLTPSQRAIALMMSGERRQERYLEVSHESIIVMKAMRGRQEKGSGFS